MKNDNAFGFTLHMHVAIKIKEKHHLESSKLILD